MYTDNELLLNPDTKVRVIKPERNLDYFEQHIIPYVGFIGYVVSIKGYTCTVQIKSGDAEVFIPVHKECLEVIN